MPFTEIVSTVNGYVLNIAHNATPVGKSFAEHDVLTNVCTNAPIL